MSSRLPFAFLSGLAITAACSRPDPSPYCDNQQAFAAANASKLAQCPGGPVLTDAGPPLNVIDCTSVLNGSSCTESDESLVAMVGADLPAQTTCVNAITPDASDGGVDCLLGVMSAEAACLSPSQYVYDGGSLSLSSECQDALGAINTYP